MRHKLRHCKVCGQSFVDRAETAEIAATCFDCRQNASPQIPATTLGSSPGPGLLSTPVILGTAAAQLTASQPGNQPPKPIENPDPITPDPIRLWEQGPKEKEVVTPAKTAWVTPPFRVRFEEYVDPDVPVEVHRPPRQGMRARYKFLLAGAVILFYFNWPVASLRTPEFEIALNDSPAADEPAPQQPGATPEEVSLPADDL